MYLYVYFNGFVVALSAAVENLFLTLITALFVYFQVKYAFYNYVNSTLNSRVLSSIILKTGAHFCLSKIYF